MNETTTGTTSSSPSSASPSSSAAVAAVSAAAAATTGAAADAAANDAAATSVKLLIKASNQQFDDQIIESDLLWTVKRLKTQLSLVYPGKPAVADQKLIYSGQLLNDTLQLKDVIRSYKDVYTHNHIFHLVYTPKNAPSPNLKKKTNLFASNSSSNNISTSMSNSNTIGSGIGSSGSINDGLRQRYVGADTTQQQQQQQQQSQQHQFPFYAQMMSAAAAAAQCRQYDPNSPQNASMPFSFPGQFNMQAMATQQAAMYNWMQQVYSQYMDQYLRLTNGTGIASISTPNTTTNTGAGAPGGNSGFSTFPPHSLLQQMPFFLSNAAATNTAAGAVPENPVIPFPSATATAAATFMAQPQATPHQSDSPTQVAVAADGAVPVVNNEQQQQQQQVAAPRFPNIVQEEQDNRDWLDSFFSITRLAIFLIILYFNSSPLRCLAVLVIAGGIYLYHIGVLRLRHERNNNNINRNNNAAPAAVDAADQIRQGVRQVQQAQAAQQQQEQAVENQQNDAMEDNAAVAVADETDPLLTISANANATDAAGATEGNPVVENADNNSSSVISFVRTFVVTFFTSLLPETPAL